MNTVTVKTQKECDAALAAGTATILIDSPPNRALRVAETGSSHVVARGSSHVVARGSSHVEAWVRKEES